MPPVRSGSLKLIISRGIRTATRRRAASLVTVTMSLIEEVRFASDSPLEEDRFELLVPVVKRRPPWEMEPELCRIGPHFQRRMMALEGSFRFSHSARSSSGIFVSVSGYPRQR